MILLPFAFIFVQSFTLTTSGIELKCESKKSELKLTSLVVRSNMSKKIESLPCGMLTIFNTQKEETKMTVSFMTFVLETPTKPPHNLRLSTYHRQAARFGHETKFQTPFPRA